MLKASTAALLALISFNVLATPGELWESRLTVTSKQHGRMEMPPQQICQRQVKTAQLSPADFMPPETKQCTKANTKQVGGTFTWDMDCPNGKSTGSMRFVGNDSYEGQMETKTRDGDFKMEFKGRKLGGTCQINRGE